MLIRIKRGLDLALPGAPEQAIEPAQPVSTVALLGPDYAMLKPSLAVVVGDVVRAGQTLFTHRRFPAVRFTAPAGGRIVSIQRGAKRRLISVVIEADGDRPAHFAECAAADSATLTPQSIRQALLASGLWVAFRTRRFGSIPSPEEAPDVILLTAIDTSPLAADPAVVIHERREFFERGTELISRLASGKTFVCRRPGSGFSLPPLDNVVAVDFAGPHPAGLPGTHAHHLAPTLAPNRIWQIGYQDVIAIGELFTTGILSNDRVVSVAGPGVHRPRLLRTRIGASLGRLLADEIKPNTRIISGSVLSGRLVSAATAYLGRYDSQVSVLDAPTLPRFAGRRGITARPSSGMVCCEAFEDVWPFRMPPLPLLRALLSGDTEAAEALGCDSLQEEDLALCSYLCPARQDYGAALRATLRQLEGAV